MKWYQPIECDQTVKNPLVCDYSNFEDFNFDVNDFLKGEEIIEWPDNIIFKANQKKYDGDPDDVLQNAYMIPIYSKALMNQLTEADIKGIQYLPVKVLSYNSDEIDTFYIANFLNYVEAFNYEKSIYTKFQKDFPNPNVIGTLAMVMKYVLYKDKIQNFDVIRLKEYEQSFFVTEIFVDLFKKNHFTGYSFKRIEVL